MTTSTPDAPPRPAFTQDVRSTGRRVLVALDLGPAAESTLRVAQARASGAGGRMAVVHVAQGPTAARDAGADTDVDAKAALRSLVRDVAGADAEQVEIQVLHGEPAAVIAELATVWRASLLIIGKAEAHGTVARMFAPGVVARLIRNAPCDVLVSGRAPASGRIVVGTDLDEPSLPLLRAAASEQARRPVTVHAVHCVEDDRPGALVRHDASHGQLREAAAQVGLTALPEVVRDVPASGLLAVARELAADLIIVGSHGDAGRARLMLGSVAQDVVEDAPCPVLVVRMPDHPH